MITKLEKSGQEEEKEEIIISEKDTSEDIVEIQEKKNIICQKKVEEGIVNALFIEMNDTTKPKHH